MTTRTESDGGHVDERDDGAPPIAAVGTQIRRLRRRRGMTLQQVATEAGLSTAMISKVETGHGNPSINTLVQIARALGVPTAMLFTHEDGAEGGVRFNHKRVYGFGGVTYTVVTPAAQGTRLLLVQAQPGAERGSPLFPHNPHEGHEQGIVLEGEMELTIHGTVYQVRQGDTIAFPSNLVHTWRNPGSVVMRAAWTISIDGEEDNA